MTHGPHFHIQEIFMRDSGDVNDDLNFEFGDGTVAHNGCGATLFGEFWYFGGGTGSTSANSQKRKMSKVVGCKLEQQSLELNFNFYKGSCQTFRQIFEFKLLPDLLYLSESDRNPN